jgi:hypothetical protein
MKCPACSGEMIAGSTKVTRSTAGFIVDIAGAFLGNSGSHLKEYLYFYPTDGGESVCVFEDTRTAFRCSKCQAVRGNPGRRRLP